MKKSVIFILIFIVFCIFLLIFFYSGFLKDNDDKIFRECAGLEQSLRMKCEYSIMNNMSDISDCDKIIDKKMRTNCYYLLSKKSTDIQVCDNVQERDKTQCLIDIYTNLAIETNDSSVCNNLELNFRFSCVSNIAIILKNQSLCNSISQNSLQYGCKELVVKQIAIDNNDIAICQEFEFQGNKYLDAWVPRARCIEQAAFCNINEDLCPDEVCKNTVRQIKEKGNTEGYICDLRQSV